MISCPEYRYSGVTWVLVSTVQWHERGKGTVVHLVNRQELLCLWECGCALLQVLRVQFLHMPVTHKTRLVHVTVCCEVMAP